MRSRLILVTMVLAVNLVTGCGDALAPELPLTVDFQAPATIRHGEAVSATATLTNTSAQTVTLEAACGPWHSEVLRADGTVLFRSWEQPQFGCMHPISLAPFASLTHTDSFTLKDASGSPAAPGTYTIAVSLRDGTGTKALVVSNEVTVVVTD